MPKIVSYLRVHLKEKIAATAFVVFTAFYGGPVMFIVHKTQFKKFFYFMENSYFIFEIFNFDILNHSINFERCDLEVSIRIGVYF